jgi:heme oxygenase (mycobilin-producing)
MHGIPKSAYLGSTRHLGGIIPLKGGYKVITVANRLYVKSEYADAFEKVFRERAGLVDKMEGFISNQVLRPVNEGDPYVVFTFWNTRQNFLDWVRSDAFVKGHAQSATLPRDAYFKSNILEMHDVLQDSSRPDLVPEPHGGPFNMH